MSEVVDGIELPIEAFMSVLVYEPSQDFCIAQGHDMKHNLPTWEYNLFPIQ